jgi:hypothetical protein
MLQRDTPYIFYIYALSDVGASSIFNYVGRSVNPEARLYQHNRWRKDNELPSVEMHILASTDTSGKCAQLERHYIRKLLDEKHPLTNQNHKDHICWTGCPAASPETDQNIDVLSQVNTPEAMRCKGISKLGVRCLNKEAYKSGFCYRHKKLGHLKPVARKIKWSRR